MNQLDELMGIVEEAIQGRPDYLMFPMNPKFMFLQKVSRPSLDIVCVCKDKIDGNKLAEIAFEGGKFYVGPSFVSGKLDKRIELNLADPGAIPQIRDFIDKTLVI